MFLFESIPWYSLLMWFAVLAGLIIINELARMNKWFSLLLFLIVPVILTIFVWPKTVGESSSVGTWIHWVTVYLVIAGCLGFMAIRFIKGAGRNKFLLMFPPIILMLTILIACIRDFQCFSSSGALVGGPWNIMNGIAGILSIITISGWMGIMMSRDKKRDMLWPDMLWFWIIAYDLWNFAYLYNCYPAHAFYSGVALLVACTFPAFFIRKGAWLQHRAQTFAVWMMFVMSLPSFVDTSMFAVNSSHSIAALYVMSSVALAANIGVFAYHLYRIIRYRVNPLKDEVYSNLSRYKEVKFGIYESDEEVYFNFGYYGNIVQPYK